MLLNKHVVKLYVYLKSFIVKLTCCLICSNEEESEEEDEASTKVASSPAMPRPDATEFPLIYLIFSSQPHSNMDMLLPHYRSLDKYMDHFKTMIFAIYHVILSVAKSAKSSVDKAFECVLHSFSHLLEDSFLLLLPEKELETVFPTRLWIQYQ